MEKKPRSSLDVDETQVEDADVTQKKPEDTLLRMTERFVQKKCRRKDPGFWGKPYTHWIRDQLDFMAFEQRYGPLISILNDLKKLEGLIVLDSGCGLGRVSILLSKQGAEVFGIDIDAERLVIANANARRCNSHPIFLRADGRKLPFPDGIFDVVTCIDVTEHIPSTEAYLSETSRVTKMAGLICCTFKNKYYWYDSHYCLFFLTWLPKPLADLYTRILRGTRYELYCLSFTELMEILTKVKLEPKRISTIARMKEIFENPKGVEQIAISQPLKIALEMLVSIFKLFRKESALTELVLTLAPNWTLILQKRSQNKPLTSRDQVIQACVR